MNYLKNVKAKSKSGYDGLLADMRLRAKKETIAKIIQAYTNGEFSKGIIEHCEIQINLNADKSYIDFCANIRDSIHKVFTKDDWRLLSKLLYGKN